MRALILYFPTEWEREHRLAMLRLEKHLASARREAGLEMRIAADARIDVIHARTQSRWLKRLSNKFNKEF